MKKLSQKARKLLRAFYLAIGAGVISLIFIACYGMPPDMCHPECSCTWCETEKADKDTGDGE